MGTNFYWIPQNGVTPLGEDIGDQYDDMSPTIHIGKRSAAGWYCFDCRVTLAIGGEQFVHSDTSGHYDCCPKCGASKNEHGHNAAMVELGFAKPPQQRLTGVQGASSFSWAQDPDTVVRVCNEHLWDAVIEDEYGATYTGQAFLWMLDMACPIRFTDSIGMHFC